MSDRIPCRVSGSRLLKLESALEKKLSPLGRRLEVEWALHPTKGEHIEDHVNQPYLPTSFRCLRRPGSSLPPWRLPSRETEHPRGDAEHRGKALRRMSYLQTEERLGWSWPRRPPQTGAAKNNWGLK